MSIKNLDIEEFPIVYVPADVKEDIKFWKIAPMMTVIICVSTLFVSLILGIILRIKTDIGWIKLLFVFFGPFILSLIIFGFNLPGWIAREISYITTASKVKTLADLSDIKDIDGPFAIYNDGSIAIFIEFVSEIPWDTATFEAKYERGIMYTFMIGTVVRPNIEVDLYSITAKEEAPLFLQRIRSLNRCKTEKIRIKAEARIRHHASIENKNARKTTYCIRLRVFDLLKGQKEKLLEQAKKAIGILDKNGSRATYLGGDALSDYIESQLIPMAPIIRGKAEDLIVDEDGMPEDSFRLMPVIRFIEKIKKIKVRKNIDEKNEDISELDEEKPGDNIKERYSSGISKTIKISTAAKSKNRSKIKILHGNHGESEK